ncbi:Jag family protein [Actinomycetospora flava]|uniref:Jag family protein n=1 Tax=Actinomycetospora flava TaxID=3129232 RepID=UPI00359F71A1
MSETVASQEKDESAVEAGSAETAPAEDASRAERSSEDQLVREGDIAGDYLERLLDILDFDGDIDLDVEAGRAVVSVDGGKDLEKLVGARGDVLEALQELTRLAVQQSTGSRNRLMLDVAGWRSQRRSELSDLGRTAAQEAKDTGRSQRLRPMTPFERKIVHDAVAAAGGVRSESEGEEPRRRVVVHPVG